MVDRLKVILGYFPEKFSGKEYNVNLPKSIELMALGMIYGKIPGILRYPLPVVSQLRPAINTVTEEFELVKEILNIPGDRACRIAFYIIGEKSEYSISYLLFLMERDLLLVYEQFFSSSEKNIKISVDLLNKWLIAINKVVSDWNEDQVKSFIEINKLLAEYIKNIRRT